MSKAITKLLQKFEWKRIGIIYDSDVLGEKVRQLIICTCTTNSFPAKCQMLGNFQGFESFLSVLVEELFDLNATIVRAVPINSYNRFSLGVLKVSLLFDRFT